MADLTHLETPSPDTPPGPPTVQDQVRFRFRKGGDLRWLSHHDLMRLFERLLRRAQLPVHHTQGFHPHPRLLLALSLPVGVVGCEEVAELELNEVVPLDEIAARLRSQAPPGLEILSVRRIGRKDRAQVRTLGYRIALPPERQPAVCALIAQLLARESILIRRREPRTGEIPLNSAELDANVDTGGVNVRPFLRRLEVCAGLLEIDLWLTPAGTARPVEVLALLGLTDLLDAGAVLERARLELHDEVSHRETDLHKRDSQ